MIAGDTAGNYVTATWTNGSDSGVGFEAWSLAAGASGGRFIGDPNAGAGISGMSTSSWGLWANPDDVNSWSQADRSFSTALKPGDTFTLQWGVNWDAQNANGNKGFNIYTGGTGGTQLIKFNLAGSGSSVITYDSGGGAQTMFSQYGTTAMTLSFVLINSTTLRVFGTGRDGAESFDSTFTVAGAPDAVRFYASRLDAGGNREPYFDSMCVYTGYRSITCTPTSSPVAQGDSFNLYMVVKDLFGDTVTSFNQACSITVSAGAITPTSTGSFSSGVRNDTFSITGVAGNVVITATNANGAITGTTALTVTIDTPTATTVAADNVTESSARLKMNYFAGKYTASLWFEWRRVGDATWTSTAKTSVAANAQGTQTATISSLYPMVHYEFRALAENTGGFAETGATSRFASSRRNAVDMYLRGDFNTWAVSDTYQFDTYGAPPGYRRVVVNIADMMNNDAFKLADAAFSAANWGGVTVNSFNQTYSMTQNGANAVFDALPSGFMTIVSPAAPGAPDTFGFLVTDSQPAYITYVQDRANVRATETAPVTIHTSHALSPGETLYVRYTTTGWASSDTVVATGSDTLHTAVIPALGDDKAVQYYALTSSASAASLAASPDRVTLMLDNNNGSNYSYRSANDEFVIDANLDDYPDTARIFAGGGDHYVIFLGQQSLFIGFDKGEALGTTAADHDIIAVHIRTTGAAPATSTSASVAGVTHTLPFQANWHFVYVPNNGGTLGNEYKNLRKWDGGAWQVDQSWSGFAAHHNNNGIMEFSIPWANIDTPAGIEVVVNVMNNANGYLWSRGPAANPESLTGALSTAMTTWLDYPDTQAVPTPNGWEYYRCTASLSGAETHTAAFTPLLDGTKDPAWSDTPAASPVGLAPALIRQPKAPSTGDNGEVFPESGLVRALYVTNDLDYLYIGYQAFGDIYADNKSMHYGFVIGDGNPGGGARDPWRTSTRIHQYGAKVWVNGFLIESDDAMSGMTRYVAGKYAWTQQSMTAGTDFGFSHANRWGEFRVPLSAIGVGVGETVTVLMYSRHNELVPGVAGISPWQAGVASDWAETVAQINTSLAYAYQIQPHIATLRHVPDDTPVTGKGPMRSPLTPTSLENTRIRLAISPASAATSALLRYTVTNWADSASVTLANEFVTGATRYVSGNLPRFAADSVVKYYIELPLTQTNYVYGDSSTSLTTAVRATAQAGAYTFTVRNSKPTAITSVTLTPATPALSDTLVATATGTEDPDSDPITVFFEWYKDGVYQPAHDTVVAVGPPFATYLSPSQTAAGELWQARAYATDLKETAAGAWSNSVFLSALVNWQGEVPERVNEALLTDSEWVFREKTGDARTVAGATTNYDIVELRIRADADSIFFRATLSDITDRDLPLLALAFDTTNGALGGTTLAGDANTTFGTDFASPAIRWGRQVIVHTAPAGAAIIEIHNGASWQLAADSSILIDTPSNVIEFRVPRAALGLAGSETVRIAAGTFRSSNLRASAAASPTVTQTGFNLLDAIAISGVHGARTSTNDNAFQLTTSQEDIENQKLDYWFWLSLDGTGLVTLDSPTTPGGLSPPNAHDTDQLQPSFSWSASTANGAGNAVTSYLFEINTSADFSGAVTARYNLAADSLTFTLPDALSASGSYQWRVRARDRAGVLSGGTVRSLTTSAPVVTAQTPRDDTLNRDNYNKIQGSVSARRTIGWEWAPATHSLGWRIKDYAIQVSTDPAFATVTLADTITGTETNPALPIHIINAADSQALLTRGRFYYARIRAGDTGTPQNWSAWSSASDGIYLSMRWVDGAGEDWVAPEADSPIRTAHYIAADSQGIWVDSSGSGRMDDPVVGPFLDFRNIRVSADPYNLYLLVDMTNWNTAYPYIQVPISLSGQSTERSYRGRDYRPEDSYTSSEAPWHYMINALFAESSVWVLNSQFSTAGVGAYAANPTDSFVEVAVPWSMIGGASIYRGETFHILPASFHYQSGAPGDVAVWGVGNSNIVDVATDRNLAWDEVSDRLVDFGLAIRVDANNYVVGFAGTRFETSTVPTLADPAGHPPSGVNHWDYIFYNIFSTDRWINSGLTPEPYDRQMNGGDYLGMASKESLDWLNAMGINALKMSPEAEFGGGAWGYNQSDLYQVQYSYVRDNNNAFRGWDDFVWLMRRAKRRNIPYFFPDWVPGQIAGSRTSGGSFQKNPTVMTDEYERFGGRKVLQSTSTTRNWLTHNVRFLYGLGVRGLRVDNPKFWGVIENDNAGLPSTAYWRWAWDQFAPDLYTYGEIPPGDPPAIHDRYSGRYRLTGNKMMGEEGNIWSWASGGMSGADFYNTQNTRWQTHSTYEGVNNVMVQYYNNHDYDRTYHRVGDDMANSPWNMQVLMAWLATQHYPPYLFYGDEMVMGGRRGLTYPGWQGTGNTGEFGHTRQMIFDPADDPGGLSTSAILGSVRLFFRARSIFPALRWDMNASIWYNDYGGNTGNLAIRRGHTSQGEEVIVLINRATGSRDFNNVQTSSGNGTAFTDFLSTDPDNPNTTWTNGSGQITWTVPARYAAILKSNGLSFSALTITAPEGTIIDVDGNSAWTAEVGSSGSVMIDRIVRAYGSNTNRTVTAWHPTHGYNRNTAFNFFANSQTLTLTPGDFILPVAPPAPTGLRAQAQDRAVILEWEKVNFDYSHYFEYYEIWRSKDTNDNYQLVAYTLNPTFYDNDYDRNTDGSKLGNGSRYYYKVRAMNRHDASSGWSNEVSATPYAARMTFQLDLRNSGLPTGSIKNVWIKGNSWQFGAFDMQGLSPFNTGIKLMTPVGRDIWEFTVDDYDPGMLVNYVHLVEYQDPSWAWSSEDWRWTSTITYENGRNFIVPHQASSPHVRRWGVLGDQAPQSPEGLTAVAGDSSARIGWSRNLEADLEGYRLYRSVVSGDVGDMALATSIEKDALSFTDAGLANGTPYWYRLRAVDIAGNVSDWSDSVRIVPVVGGDTSATSAPVNLQADNAGLNQVRLTWDRVNEANVSGYHVYRATSPTFELTMGNRLTQTLLADSFTPTYTDTSAQPGVDYHYVVTAVNTVGIESDSSAARQVTLNRVAFSVDMGAINPTSVHLRSSSAYIGTSPGLAMSQVAGMSATWAVTTDLIVGSAIQYRYAFNTDTQELDFTTSSGYRERTIPDQASISYEENWQDVPDKITGFTGQSAHQAAWLFWEENTLDQDIVGYNIYQQSDTGLIAGPLNPTPIAVDKPIFQVTVDMNGDTLVNGVTYGFLVRAVEGGDQVLESEDSRMVNVTPTAIVYVRFRN